MSEKREPGWYIVRPLGEGLTIARLSTAGVHFADHFVRPQSAIAEWGPRLLPDPSLIQVPKAEWEALLKLFAKLFVWLREMVDDLEDIEGWKLQKTLIDLGIMETVPATADDAKEHWAREWGIEEGDDCVKPTEMGRSLLNRLDSLHQASTDEEDEESFRRRGG